MPLVAPKLPSIWNGGWASNRFGEREQIVEHAMGPVAVAEPGPQIDLPGERPTRAAVAPHVERLASGGQELRRIAVDFLAREHGPQMRHMPMPICGVVDVFEPFLQLAVLTDLVRRHALFERPERETRHRRREFRRLRSCWQTGCE
jgi:hypothetical protein